MIHIHFSNAESPSRWAWTDGLQTLGQREVAVRVPWPEHDPRDLLITRLLTFLEQYLSSQPKRILPGQTLRYGWTTLRFVHDEQNLSGAGTESLLIEEMQAPFTQEQPSYVLGVTRTLTLLHIQNEAIRRNRITGDTIYPHGSQRAFVCTRVTPETVLSLRPLMAHRARQPDTRESGWFIGCCDRDHDHDNPDELGLAHLFHLVEQCPAFFPYLAMPVGTQLLFEESRAILFRPDENEGQIDPEDLLDTLS